MAIQYVSAKSISALELHEAAALERFALSVSVPILLETQAAAVLHATGTLFEIESRVFIITARHIFDDLNDPKRLVIPTDPNHGGLSTLGAFNYVRPSEEHYDVAVIEIQSRETISFLRKQWRCLGLENIGLPTKGAEDGSFFVSGFPCDQAYVSNTRVQGSFFTAYTQMLPEFPIEPDSPIEGVDLYFDYALQAAFVNGGAGATPKPPGMSGASVWEIREKSGVWAPETATRIVGVQSSYIHSKYLHAISWIVVARVLEQIDMKLAAVVRNALESI